MKAIILGNSFSLHDNPTPKRLPEMVFGVNRIFLSDMWRNHVTHYCALDPYLWKHNRKEIASLPSGCKLYTQDTTRSKPIPWQFAQDVLPLHMIGRECQYGNDTIIGFGHGHSSSYPCILLAYYLGNGQLEEIEIRGVDWGYPPRLKAQYDGTAPETATHFFGERRRRDKTLKLAKDCMIRLLQYLKSKDIEIRVLSRLEWWQNGKL